MIVVGEDELSKCAWSVPEHASSPMVRPGLYGARTRARAGNGESSRSSTMRTRPRVVDALAAGCTDPRSAERGDKSYRVGSAADALVLPNNFGGSSVRYVGLPTARQKSETPSRTWPSRVGFDGCGSEKRRRVGTITLARERTVHTARSGGRSGVVLQ